MFTFHITYALELIAMGLGVILLVWAVREKGKGVVLAKTFGYIITVLAVILFLCSLWSNFVAWRLHQQWVRSIQMQQNIRPVILQQLMQQRLQQKNPNVKPQPQQKPQSNVAPHSRVHKQQAAGQNPASKPSAGQKPATTQKAASAPRTAGTKREVSSSSTSANSSSPNS